MIDVVVPTYRGAQRVHACLAALAEDGAPHRPIVVDDGSGDGTDQAVRAAHPGAIVIALVSNSGFPRAANAGLRASESDIVILLNDDVQVRPGFLEALAAPFADARVGMAAPVILQRDGATVESLGIEADIALAGFARHWGTPAAAADELTHEHLLGPSGGAAAYRREALAAVGFFDEGIVAYNEDLDLALRLRAAGWRCAPVPGAVAVHTGSATFGRRSARQLHAKGHSRFYLLRKYGVLGRPRAAALALAGELTSVARQLASDRSGAGLRGRLEGWRAARDVREELATELLNPEISIADAWRRRRAYGG